MIWLFIIYIIGTLYTFFFFVYNDIKSKELGAFDGFGYLMFSTVWPIIWSVRLYFELQEYKRMNKNESIL